MRPSVLLAAFALAVACALLAHGSVVRAALARSSESSSAAPSTSSSSSNTTNSSSSSQCCVTCAVDLKACGDECVNAGSVCLRPKGCACDIALPDECWMSRDMGVDCIGKPARELWFFDTRTLECDRFTFLGCEGNDNRFKTREECEKKCPPNSYMSYMTGHVVLPVAANRSEQSTNATESVAASVTGVPSASAGNAESAPSATASAGATSSPSSTGTSSEASAPSSTGGVQYSFGGFDTGVFYSPTTGETTESEISGSEATESIAPVGLVAAETSAPAEASEGSEESSSSSLPQTSQGGSSSSSPTVSTVSNAPPPQTTGLPAPTMPPPQNANQPPKTPRDSLLPPGDSAEKSNAALPAALSSFTPEATGRSVANVSVSGNGTVGGNGTAIANATLQASESSSSASEASVSVLGLFKTLLRTHHKLPHPTELTFEGNSPPPTDGAYAGNPIENGAVGRLVPPSTIVPDIPISFPQPALPPLAPASVMQAMMSGIVPSNDYGGLVTPFSSMSPTEYGAMVASVTKQVAGPSPVGPGGAAASKSSTSASAASMQSSGLDEEEIALRVQEMNGNAPTAKDVPPELTAAGRAHAALLAAVKADKENRDLLALARARKEADLPGHDDVPVLVGEPLDVSVDPPKPAPPPPPPKKCPCKPKRCACTPRPCKCEDRCECATTMLRRQHEEEDRARMKCIPKQTPNGVATSMLENHMTSGAVTGMLRFCP